MAGLTLRFAAVASAVLLVSPVTAAAAGSTAAISGPPSAPAVAELVLLANDGVLPVSGDLAVITASTPPLPTLAAAMPGSTTEAPATLAELLGASSVIDLGAAVPAGLPGGAAIPPELLGAEGAGLDVEYFAGADLSIPADLQQAQPSSVVRLPVGAAATRVSGQVAIPLDGSYEFTLTSTGGARMLVDGVEVARIDAPNAPDDRPVLAPDVPTTSVTLELTGGTVLPVQVEMVDETSPEPVLVLGWRPPDEVISAGVAAAEQAAAAADTVLVHVPSLPARATDADSPAAVPGALPEDFAQLLTRVAASNPRIAVVTDAAADDDLRDWTAPAVLHAPTGAVDLESLAGVVTGALQPGGSLQADLPLPHGPPLEPNTQEPQPDAAPLYPAGHGLTYWRYELRSIAAAVEDGGAAVALEVASVGTAAGATPLYVSASTAGSEQLRPVANAAVELAAGETGHVTIPLDLSALDLDSPENWPVTLRAGTSPDALTLSAELAAPESSPTPLKRQGTKPTKQQKQGGIVRPPVPGLALTTGAGAVTLDNAVHLGGHLRLSGSLPTVSVSDARQGAGAGWTVSARASDLTGPGGTLPASNLGWAPIVLTTTTGVSAGPVVAGSLSGGQGLGEPAVLGHASEPVGTVQFGADFVLETPASTVPGSYTGTLTVTLFPAE